MTQRLEFWIECVKTIVEVLLAMVSAFLFLPLSAEHFVSKILGPYITTSFLDYTCPITNIVSNTSGGVNKIEKWLHFPLQKLKEHCFGALQ